MGSRATSGATIKSKSSWSCASPGTGARRSIYLSYFSAISSHFRLEVLSVVHRLHPQNVTLQFSAIFILLHHQDLPVASCFPWESRVPARAVSLNPKRTVAILNVGVAGEPIARVSARPAEKPFLNFAACDPPGRCLSSFTR